MYFYIKEPPKKLDMFNTTAIVYKEYKYLSKSDQESLFCLSLNNKLKMLGFDIISMGGISSSMASSVILFRRIISKGANRFILMHNHTSGDPTPSREDNAFTKKVVDGSKLLDLGLVDHIIIGDEKYYSYKESTEILNNICGDKYV